MGNHRDLAVLDAADLLADDVNRLIDESPRRLIHTVQLRKAAQAIGANISEGFGRGPGAERNHSLRVARGEAEETIRHLRANYGANRIEQAVFWRFRNRLVTIIKMLTALLKRASEARSRGNPHRSRRAPFTSPPPLARRVVRLRSQVVGAVRPLGSSAVGQFGRWAVRPLGSSAVAQYGRCAVRPLRLSVFHRIVPVIFSTSR